MGIQTKKYILLFAIWILCFQRNLHSQAPLLRCHAHNDYQNREPLKDALRNGFTSVEADVFRVGDKLILAHVSPAGKKKKTLDRLYLEPLLERVKANGGTVYKDSPAVLTLMVEFKTAWEETYPVLLDHLRPFHEILFHWEDSTEIPGAVKILITGNAPPLEKIKSEKIRWICLDGNPGDLERAIPNSFVPRISLNWRGFSSWRGKGELPENDKARLFDLAKRCEAQGKELRFWAAPQNAAFWKLFLSAGSTTVLQTDYPEILAAFLCGMLPETKQP